MWLLATEEGCPQKELDDRFDDVLMERYAATQALAMSHNKVFKDLEIESCNSSAITRTIDTCMERHYMKCREYNQCMGCIVRRSYQDDMSCVHCGDAWRLSIVSRAMKDHVVAHGLNQTLWENVSPPPPVIKPDGYEPIDAPGHHAAFGSGPPHVALTVDESGEDLWTDLCFIVCRGYEPQCATCISCDHVSASVIVV